MVWVYYKFWKRNATDGAFMASSQETYVKILTCHKYCVRHLDTFERKDFKTLCNSILDLLNVFEESIQCILTRGKR